MARALIVDEFLGNHDDWQHLAMEDIQEQNMDMDENMDTNEEDVFGFQMAFMTMVACECAKEARALGHRILITCPESEMLEGIYSEIEEPIISVFLGTKEDSDGFDHVINSSEKSMVEVCKFLNDIIQTTPA